MQDKDTRRRATLLLFYSIFQQNNFSIEKKYNMICIFSDNDMIYLIWKRIYIKKYNRTKINEDKKISFQYKYNCISDEIELAKSNMIEMKRKKFEKNKRILMVDGRTYNIHWDVEV